MRPPVTAGLNSHHSRTYRTASSSSSSRNDRDEKDRYDTGCPLVLFSQYMQAMQLGLPIDRQPDLECSCTHVLDSIVTDANRQLQCTSSSKPDAGDYELHGASLLAGPVHDARSWNAAVTDRRGQLVPDDSPVAALRCSDELEAMSNTLRIVNASVAALQWLESGEGRAAYPALFDGSMA
jgi:hypothetical protein